MTQLARPDPARTPSRPRRPGGLVPRWTVVPAALSPVLATAGWLVADAVQPASYSPVRKTISVLAGHAGTDRWIMTGALFLVGRGSAPDRRGPDRRPAPSPPPARRHGPVQHRHRRISRTRSRFDSAAHRL